MEDIWPILQTNFNLEVLTIEDLASEKKLGEIMSKEVLHEVPLGLTVIELQDSAVVCFVGAKKIFAGRLVDRPNISSYSEQELRVIKRTIRILKGPEKGKLGNVVFASLDLEMDAYLLSKYLKRDVCLNNTRDLTSYDILVTCRQIKARDLEPPTYYKMSHFQKKNIPLRNLEALVHRWLNLKLDLKPTPEEQSALDRDLLSDLSVNLIKKRAALVRILAIEMDGAYRRQEQRVSKNIYSLAVRADDQSKEVYERNEDRTYLGLCSFLQQCPDECLEHSAYPEHRSLLIEQYGDPKENLILKVRKPEEVLPRGLESDQVVVEHLAACVNPADINLIQGVYGKKPPLPCVVGNEGVVRVSKVGSAVDHVKVGDIALAVSLVGYWQSYSVQKAHDLFKIDPGLDTTLAAQLKVNPCTAYRMIKDFYPLSPGDAIIQNGANSAVGVYAIQLAKHWGFKTINVIRDKPNKDELVKELKDFGADFVLTEKEVSSVDFMKPILKQTGKPKLLLNCVGGKNAMDCQRLLDNGGFSVTYGAMSRQAFNLSASALIFKDHRYVGFWVSRWYQEREMASRRHEIQAMLDEVGNMFKKGTLRSKSTTLVDFDDWAIALNNTGSSNTKYMFSINKR